MNKIYVDEKIDLNAIVNKWTEDEEINEFFDEVWDLKYYPIRGDILVIAFEHWDEIEDFNDTVHYRFVLYDLKNHKFLEKEYDVELESMSCCTVVAVKENGLLLDVEDCVEDCNFVYDTENKCVLVNNGFGVSVGAPIVNSDKYAVGYGYTAINRGETSVVKITGIKDGAIYEYKNDKTLGCNDLYASEDGAIWAALWGYSKLIKIQENQVYEYGCEMSGFDSFMLSGDNKYLYAIYHMEYGTNKIFRMEFDGSNYVNATKMDVVFNNEQGEDRCVKAKGFSMENGRAVCLLERNIIGVLNMK